MEIVPGKGVGDLRFGLTEQDLIQALGPPDKAYRTESEVLRLQYFGLRLEFAIEPENGSRFGWVEVWNPEATLLGKRIVGEPSEAVVSFLTETLGEQPEAEDYDSFTTFFYPTSWVELHVRFGRLESINFGVVYDESDEPMWPT
jgi:hypothetical protein